MTAPACAAAFPAPHQPGEVSFVTAAGLCLPLPTGSLSRLHKTSPGSRTWLRQAGWVDRRVGGAAECGRGVWWAGT